MRYLSSQKSFSVTQQDMERAAHCFIYAIRSIRECANITLDKYEQHGMLSDADHAQKGILDGALALGIDLGAEWGSDLDVRPQT